MIHSLHPSPFTNRFQVLNFREEIDMDSKRADCCEHCLMDERGDGCKNMIARCCPPGTTSRSSCADCKPCYDFRGTEFKKASEIRPYLDGHARHDRPYAVRREARELNLRNAGGTRRGRLP